MGLMFHRDVMVLGLSDGVMCFFFTAFGFILQKLIASGYMSWNKEGWIIQSVGNMFLDSFTVANMCSGLGNPFSAWFFVLDSVQRMALDTHCFLRASYPCDAHEAALILVL
jgi:hypothetical protein